MKKINLSTVPANQAQDLHILLSELVGKTAAIQEEAFSIAHTFMKPWTTAQSLYHHHSKEVYLVLSGLAETIVDDSNVSITAGDVIMVNPHERHHVVTKDEEIRFLAFTLPAYTQEDFLIE